MDVFSVSFSRCIFFFFLSYSVLISFRYALQFFCSIPIETHAQGSSPYVTWCPANVESKTVTPLGHDLNISNYVWSYFHIQRRYPIALLHISVFVSTVYNSPAQPIHKLGE